MLQRWLRFPPYAIPGVFTGSRVVKAGLGWLSRCGDGGDGIDGSLVGLWDPSEETRSETLGCLFFCLIIKFSIP